MPDTGPGGGTLLLVDDEPGILQILGLILHDAGYRCLFAHDGVEGLEIFRQHHALIRGIITDVNMPYADGFELIRGIRSHAPQMKFLVCSGSLAEGDARIPPDVRIDAFLPKPFSAA